MMAENNTISMIFTHNGRMRCFINKLLVAGGQENKTHDVDFIDDASENLELSSVGTSEYFTPASRTTSNEYDYDSDASTEPSAHDDGPLIVGGQKASMPRFKNGSVVEVKIDDRVISIRLLISGEIDEHKPDKYYYVTPEEEFTDVNMMRGSYKVMPFRDISFENNFYDIKPGNTYTFYLVRHGQGTHNVKKLSTVQKAVKKIKDDTAFMDAELTPEGREQAERTGKKFRELITKKAGNPVFAPEFLFASDLLRTRQTAIEFIKGMGIPFDVRNIQIYVLPCSHELDYVKGGKCDGNQGITAPENTSICTTNNYKCLYEGGFSINWDYYYEFYGNATREKLCKSNCQKCRNTDMIKEAMKIIKKEKTGYYLQGRPEKKVTFDDKADEGDKIDKRLKGLGFVGGTRGRNVDGIRDSSLKRKAQAIHFVNLLQHIRDYHVANERFELYLINRGEQSLLTQEQRLKLFNRIEYDILNSLNGGGDKTDFEKRKEQMLKFLEFLQKSDNFTDADKRFNKFLKNTGQESLLSKEDRLAMFRHIEGRILRENNIGSIGGKSKTTKRKHKSKRKTKKRGKRKRKTKKLRSKLSKKRN